MSKKHRQTQVTDAPAEVRSSPADRHNPPLETLTDLPTRGARAPTTTANVFFVLEAPQAKLVTVCGEFNQWGANAIRLKRQAGGRWELVLALRPGRYQYKFVVDGEWRPDPQARENIPDGYGALNSVIEVRLNETSAAAPPSKNFANEESSQQIQTKGGSYEQFNDKR